MAKNERVSKIENSILRELHEAGEDSVSGLYAASSKRHAFSQAEFEGALHNLLQWDFVRLVVRRESELRPVEASRLSRWLTGAESEVLWVLLCPKGSKFLQQ